VEKTNLVEIRVRDFGNIVVELYPDVAPITVEHFKGLVAEGFYNGLIFHRVIADFMIQGGGYSEDYNYVEMGRPSIVGEFSSNGFENNLSHTKGVISMARSTLPDSATSQFFIMHKDTPRLDGEYAAFGCTVYGLEVVDQIAVVPTGYYDIPLVNVVINEIYFVKPR
jgi:peptidyl-prolyl cis-trans isomerase B (cyclophilin B)